MWETNPRAQLPGATKILFYVTLREIFTRFYACSPAYNVFINLNLYSFYNNAFFFSHVVSVVKRVLAFEHSCLTESAPIHQFTLFTSILAGF
jgi:hypothetical protein